MPAPSKADQIARLRQFKYSDGNPAIVAKPAPVYEPVRAIEDVDSDFDFSQAATALAPHAPDPTPSRHQPASRGKKRPSDKRKPRNITDSPHRQDLLIRAISRDVVATLKDLATAQDRSLNWLAIHILTEYVEQHSLAGCASS